MLRAGLLGLLVLLAAACGGGGGAAGSPSPADGRELTGYATPDGQTFETFQISAKGAVGPPRTNGYSGNPARMYSLTTEQLTPPFLIRSAVGGDVSVATTTGRANVTQLTSLMTIALFGQSQADAFNDYGDSSAAQIALIQDSELRRAQADATAFLEQRVGVPVRSGDASFVTTAFEPVAGDPMWDTLVDLNRRIAELGPDAYAALVAAFLQRQFECRRGQLEIVVDGSTQRFCPTAPSSTADVADPSVQVHAYAQTTGETLTVRTRGRSVLEAVYVTAGGARYACSAAACDGLVPGRAAYDGTRRLVFASVRLAGAGGRAEVSGRLPTQVAGVSLPDLPCFVGALWKIRPDGSSESGCADNSSALQVLAIAGTLGAQQGASTYADYTANGVDVVLDGGTLSSVTAFVTSADGLSSVTAACRGSGCRGVTIGNPTVNTQIGFDTTTRPVRFDGTPLRAVTADGSLGPDIVARLKGELRLIYFSNVRLNYATPDDPPACTGAALIAQLVPTDTPDWTYRVCYDGSMPIYATPLEGGGVDIGFNGQISVRTDADGAVVQARLLGFNGGGAISESFGCDGIERCAGVRVSAPRADGGRTVRIDGASFRRVGYDGFAIGPRRARAEASFDTVPLP